LRHFSQEVGDELETEFITGVRFVPPGLKKITPAR